MTQELFDVGRNLNDVDKIANVLGTLPPKYWLFLTAWNSYDETKHTFEN